MSIRLRVFARRCAARLSPISWVLCLIIGSGLQLQAAEAAEARAASIAVIGASAHSSREIIWQALASGLRVTAITRDPSKFELRHERLTVLKGDAYDSDSIAAALNGDEVVISMIGPRVDPTKEVASMDLYSVGTGNIVKAMRSKGNKRLLVASSIGVENPFPETRPAGSDPSVLWLWNSRRLYADMKQMEDNVRSSGLEYVIFRPAFMLDEPPRHDLKLSVNSDSPKGRMITFADFGELVLTQVAGERYVGKTVGVYADRELRWGKTADFAKLSSQMTGDGKATLATTPATTTPGANTSTTAPAAAPAARELSVQRGRALAATCTPCHGDAGVSPSPAFPIIAGQQYDYLISALLGYLSGTRQDSIMGGAIRTLSRTQIEDLAAYYASLSGLRGSTPTASASDGSSAASAAPSPALTAAVAAAEAARALQAPVSAARGNNRAELQLCMRIAKESSSADRDNDGLADRFDAAPDNAGEFAADADHDGFFAICSAEQLQAIATLGTASGKATALDETQRLARNYELVTDLDLGSLGNFAPIGHCGPANNCMISRDRFGYSGHFDGNDHTLSNLHVNKPESGGVGLFGTLARNGAITHLRLSSASSTGANGTGLLVGAMFGYVADCQVQGKVDGRVAIGGLTGGNAGRIVRVSADVEVHAIAAVGGLVGDMNGVVSDSTATVHVTGGKGVGGLVGLSTYGTVLRSSTRGSVTGDDNIGGLIGVNTDAKLAASYSSAAVTSTGTNAGGLVGYSSQSAVANVYASGDVKGNNGVGGLIGRNNGAVTAAFAVGRVSGQSNVGGLVGDNLGGVIQSGFWDTDSSGIRTGAGTARSTSQLKMLDAGSSQWDAAQQICDAGGRQPKPRESEKYVWVFGAGAHYPAIGCTPGGVAAQRSVTTPRVNTMRPFAAGDVFVAATVMNNPTDDHAGAGRILQYDADLHYKGELWLQGTTHKVGGLTFGPGKTLWAMAQLTPAVVEIAPNGRQKPLHHWSDRKFSSVTFAPDGGYYFGEHMIGTQTGHPAITTKFKLLAGRDVIGDGHIFRFNPQRKLVKEYATAAHGGIFGFLGVTSTVLADHGSRMIYVSETGNVVKQFDLEHDKQLPDLATFNKDPAMPMVLVMNAMPNGQLLISNGGGFVVMDSQSGQILRNYPIDGNGWAAVNASADSQSVYVGNFWSGDVVKVRLSDGVVTARANVGEKKSLSGIAQFGG